MRIRGAAGILGILGVLPTDFGTLGIFGIPLAMTIVPACLAASDHLVPVDRPVPVAAVGCAPAPVQHVWAPVQELAWPAWALLLEQPAWVAELVEQAPCWPWELACVRPSTCLSFPRR